MLHAGIVVSACCQDSPFRLAQLISKLSRTLQRPNKLTERICDLLTAAYGRQSHR